MRVFKTKPLARWARKEKISDETFREAGKEVTEGKFEADLGKNLFKKRIPREGEGKSGGFRTIVAFKKPNSDRVIFMHGFAKSDKSNIIGKEKHILSTIAQYYIEASDGEVKKLLEAGELLEIQEAHKNE
jgi:hypothetical protein